MNSGGESGTWRRVLGPPIGEQSDLGSGPARNRCAPSGVRLRGALSGASEFTRFAGSPLSAIPLLSFWMVDLYGIQGLP